MDLVALTSMESGYRAKVCNGEGTSACGLGSMTSRTYYTMVKRYGKQVGVKPGCLPEECSCQPADDRHVLAGEIRFSATAWDARSVGKKPTWHTSWDLRVPSR
jgi:hypothetical protein